MSAETCAVCQKRPTPDGYVCVGCTSRAAGHLAAIVELAPDARLVAAGLVRRGRGGSGGKPGSRPPLNDGATDAVDAVQNALTTLARDVAETRGLQSVSKPSESRLVPDPLISAARFLSGQLEWLRHAVDDQGEPYAVHAFAEIDHCAGRLRGLVEGPREQRFLGPCRSKVTWDDDGNEIERDEPCPGDVFANLGAEKGTCRACKARWATKDRRAWLDGEVRSHAFRASQIAEAYGVNENNIRTWSTRPRPDTGQPPLKSYYRTEAGIVADWVEPPEGEKRPRLHYVGDVLDLEEAAAVRRREAQAKRARRAAAKAEEASDAA